MEKERILPNCNIGYISNESRGNSGKKSLPPVTVNDASTTENFYKHILLLLMHPNTEPQTQSLLGGHPPQKDMTLEGVSSDSGSSTPILRRPRVNRERTCFLSSVMIRFGGFLKE